MRTRFAPSPNGYLHLGHAFSALNVWQAATDMGGEALLRIDDIDQSRARSEFETAIFEDLTWLGLRWPAPVRRQSDHLTDYAKALERLKGLGLTYPCFCTRKTLKTNALGHYAGTCKALTRDDVNMRLAGGEVPNIRLNAAAALKRAGNALRYMDSGVVRTVGETPMEDTVLARRDIKGSYLLSCVIDDAAQGITHVVRGCDIQPMTATQVLLQDLLNLPKPIYVHHRLLTDPGDQKLSKSKGSQSLRDLKQQGATATDLKAQLGFS